jgi:hypothetical protein
MRAINTIILLISISLILIFLVGCQQTTPIPTPVSQTACKTDADCACGTHKDTGACFYGNKAFVNVEKQCPDFCTGIAAMFETKCVNNECKQVRIQPAAECAVDDDCVPEQCCHATTCINKDKKGVCNLACTMECRGGTIDCGGYCSCENGKCVAQLNDL